MPIPESPQLEAGSKEPFNRADCVRNTAQSFSPYPFLLIQRLELRYLPDNDVYVKPGERLERLHSFDLAAAQRMGQFSDPGVELTDERLQEFCKQGIQARRDLGSTIVTRARQFGLVETLTSEQAKARLALAPHVNLAEEVDQQYGIFSFSGWDVFPDAQDIDKPVLIMPNRSEEGQITFEVVNLDNLNALDPEFLPLQIRGYEEKNAMHSLASSVTYNLNLHEIPESELLPEHMRALAQIADPEQRAREILYMQRFMSWMVSLGYDHSETVRLFKRELSMKHINMEDGRSVGIKYYLEHMGKCPAQTEEVHQRNVRLTEVFNVLLSVDHHYPYSFGLQAANPVRRVLQEPVQHTVYLDRAEKRNAAGKEQDQKVVDFITNTGDATDQVRLLEALQQELPDFHTTIVRFQEWLGTDYFEKSKFDELISRTAENIYFAGDKFDLKKLDDTLRRNLIIATSLTRGEFEGVYTGYRSVNTGASLYNPHLEAILPLMAIKAAQSGAEVRKGEEFLGNYHERQVQCAKRLIQELAQSYREKIKVADETLEDIAKKRQALASLQEQTGITNEEVAHLIELATPEDGKDNNGFNLIDAHLYTGLFNALVLEKQGMVDMHTPAFKELLKSLFPGRPDRVWANL